jgi:hypothetical protein
MKAPKPPAGALWLHEIKHDVPGHRPQGRRTGEADRAIVRVLFLSFGLASPTKS